MVPVALVQRSYLLDDLHTALVYDPSISSIGCVRKSLSSKCKHCSFEQRRSVRHDEGWSVNHREEWMDPTPESTKITLIIGVVDLVESKVNGRTLWRRCGYQEIVHLVQEVSILRREHTLRGECAKRELLIRHM